MTKTEWPVWRNKLTYLGGFIAVVALLFILSFLFFDLVTAQPSPYIGVFTFLVFPAFLVLGIVLIVIGLLVARRQLKRRMQAGDATQYLPRVDLNRPRDRRILMGIGVVLLLILPFIGVMSYQGYEYTDSDQFCGMVCHRVMDPQFTAHLHSPHARVACADCHIGPGATWYVKSKLSGLRQVIATILNTYPRPLPTAITELRPATETCEQCHWPAVFIGNQLVTIHYFAPDEKSTPEELRILVKTGGAEPSMGPPSGIHWHMALGHRIEYVATDHALQHIPWVRATDDQTGKQVVYRSDGVSGDALPAGTHRTVDCMDCHNRATHIFRSPAAAADGALNLDPGLRALPFAKRELVAAVVKPYASKVAGFTGVAEALRAFYQAKYAELATKRKEELDRLVAAAQEIYRVNFFPNMEVTWRTYPDNVGHKEFPGCFRCHDGKHVDATGNAISHDCSSCHEFLVPTQPATASSPIEIGGFHHPIKLQGPHATMLCDRCHTGGVAPPPTCAACHVDVTAFRAGTSAAFASFGISAEPMNGDVGCEDCHDLSEPTDAETLNEACLECHDDTTKFSGIVKKWQDEAAQLFQQAEAHVGPADRKTLDALRAAGPLHNMDATRKILHALAASEDSRR